MSRTIDLKASRNINKIIKITCSHCNGDRNHLVVSGTQVDGKDYHSPEDYFGWMEEYEVIQCQGCENVAFRKTYEDEESRHWDEELQTEVYYKTIKVYPKPDGRVHGIKDKHLLPSKLLRIYAETLESLNNDHTVISGIGIRAIVETVCKDGGTTSRDLYGRINELKDSNVLSTSGAEILHKLRVLGNNAAHDVEPQSISQLKLAFDVIDNVLHSVYILPKQTAAAFPAT
ncbi:DUF4145 domain-containing protein [Aliivibrio fischeri]|uniref:DUF4145 domain-containing protein n=1 Tax=Aliivibrio fischeri TaxID=668 RepID=UPI0012D94234|nr:DUF4145 domain-containing protein [Aliivibrio fischeri]MUK78959.1 DUF4145 domain-containing protein [Aliivibrio fischeri]